MKKKAFLILILILLFALALRLYKIHVTTMYGDELTMLEDTYSIAKTGMDATGQKFPITFKMGAGRPGGYIYFSVPFIKMFGPTDIGIRTLSLLSGLGLITTSFFLGRKFFDEKTGLIAAGLMAISPWDIFLSRGGFEAHFALFLAFFGILMFLNKKYIIWALAWGIAIHTYPTFKLTLPLTFLVLAWYQNIKEIYKDKKFWIGIVTISLFGALAILQTFSGGSENRFLSINVFSDKNVYQSIVQKINYERTISKAPGFVTNLFLNKQLEYSKIVLGYYVQNISPNFLFISGDGNPRHNPAEMGELYLIDFLLIALGVYLVWKKDARTSILLLSLILIAPLATMFFPEAHSLRNGLMLPALILFSAYTFSKFNNRFKIAVAALYLLQLSGVLFRIYYIAPDKFATFWSKQAMEFSIDAIKNDKLGIKTILYTKKVDNIEYAYPIYAKIDPKLVIEQYGKFPKIYGNVTISDQ